MQQAVCLVIQQRASLKLTARPVSKLNYSIKTRRTVVTVDTEANIRLLYSPTTTNLTTQQLVYTQAETNWSDTEQL